MIDDKIEDNCEYVKLKNDILKFSESNIVGYFAIIISCILLVIVMMLFYISVWEISDSVHSYTTIMFIVFAMLMCTIAISLIERLYTVFCKYHIKKVRILIKHIEVIDCLNQRKNN